LVRRLHTRKAIKRESGVNPEQSRCCKFYNYVASNLLLATGRRISGKALATGTSQKTCHATNFTAFEEKALNLMNRTIPSIISFIILIQRKYVVINSAKSLFMRVRSKGFRPDTFKPKKRKWKRGL